jgi:hypothetical protein
MDLEDQQGPSSLIFKEFKQLLSRHSIQLFEGIGCQEDSITGGYHG